MALFRCGSGRSEADYQNVLDQLITETASGSVASSLDGANNLPIISANMDISAPAGSGGYTGATFKHTRKNLVDITNISSGDTSFNVLGLNICFPCCLSLHLSDDFSVSSDVWEVRTELLDGTYSHATPQRSAIIMATRENPIKIVRCRSTYITSGFYDVQIEPGQSPTGYEEYTSPTIYPISWENEAGAIYDGTLNLLTGVLTADGQTYQLTPLQLKTFLGSNTFWSNTGDSEVEYYANGDLYVQQHPVSRMLNLSKRSEPEEEKKEEIDEKKIEEEINDGTEDQR